MSTAAAGIAGRPPDRSARFGGVFLLATAAITVAMVYTRIAADADQDTLLESLLAVDENRTLYGASGVLRLIVGADPRPGCAWLLLQTWIIRDRWATPVVPYLFALSGILTVLSGAFAIVIAAYPAPQVTVTNGVVTGEVSQIMQVVSDLRWITGKAEFTAAGLAIIVAARYQWQVGGTLRFISPASLVIGVAMQLIWVDAATIMHPIIGAVFFVWLVAVGTMLSTGRVEKHFVARYSPAST